MKKVLLFAAVLSAFSFASCKKDYTCSCTTTYTNGDPSYTFNGVTVKTTKKKSKTICDAYEYTDADETTTCVAK